MTDKPATHGTRLDATIAPLAAIAALGQFEIAVSLPSLPAMARSFGVSISLIQLSVSAVYAGFGLVQILGGILVERFGRRPLAVLGLLLFLAATLAAMQSSTPLVLMIARFFQGSGCALAIVAARATVRDRFDGPALGRALAALNIASALISGSGSAIGGLLQDKIGWRGAFLCAAAVGVGVLALTITSFPKGVRVAAPTPAFSSYRRVLGSPVFLSAMAVAVSLSIGEFAMLLSAPVIFEVQLGLTASRFGLLPPLMLIAYSLGAVLAARMAERWSDRRISLIASIIGLIAALALLLVAETNHLAVWSALSAIAVFVFCVGLAVPAATAMAICPFGDIAGPASAAMGVLLIVGVLLGSLAAALRIGSPAMTAAAAAAVAAGLSILSLVVIRGNRR